MLLWMPSKSQPFCLPLPVIMTRHGLSSDAAACQNSQSHARITEKHSVRNQSRSFYSSFFLLFALWYRPSYTQRQSQGASRSATPHHMHAEFCGVVGSLEFIVVRPAMFIRPEPTKTWFCKERALKRRDKVWFVFEENNYNKMWQYVEIWWVWEKYEK